mgnify:CR=1 FL=1
MTDDPATGLDAVRATLGAAEDVELDDAAEAAEVTETQAARVALALLA